MKEKLLIIGVTGKYRGSDVYSWQRLASEHPLIGDYRSVIVYMPSLNADLYGGGEHHSVFSNVLKGIQDALRGNTHVHYIIAPPVQFTNRGTYTLMPFAIGYDLETGKNFKHKAKQDLPYVEKVAGWQVAFKDNPHNFSTDNLRTVVTTLARTNHEKNAAFRVTFFQPNNGPKAGTLDVVPPLMENGKASEVKTITELIDYYLPIDEVEAELPERYKSMTLPGEAELLQEDTELEEAISSALERRNVISGDLKEFEKLKGVVAFQGKPLEKAVDLALGKLGLEYEPTETNKEDGNIALTASLKVPVEIKGHETKGSSERDLRQLIARLKDHTADQPVRGILIVNPFYTLSREEQSGKKAFEPSVVDGAKAFHIALLDTRVLLKYLIDQFKTGKNSLSATLTSTAGVTPYNKATPANTEEA